MDGERPLEFEPDITSSFRELDPLVDRFPICFACILKAFPQETRIKLNSDKAKPSVRRGRKAAVFLYDGRAAFGLMVTLFWLYLEILRLLTKIIGKR